MALLVRHGHRPHDVMHVYPLPALRVWVQVAADAEATERQTLLSIMRTAHAGEQKDIERLWQALRPSVPSPASTQATATDDSADRFEAWATRSGLMG